MTRMIEKPIVPWSGRGHSYTSEEVAVVARVMQEADPLTQGEYQKEFEKRFTEYVGCDASFAVSSCSAALQLAATLIKAGPGDEIIIPAHTFAATAIPFARTGAQIRWADIDPATRVVSIESIRKNISSNTKAIVVVHLYGLMADMDPILALARERGIIVIEDAAQAIGASYKGRKAGSLGDLGCFSFHTHKNMTTLGEGGMLTVNRKEWIALIPGLRHHGMRPYPPDREHYWIPAMTNVDFDWQGVWPYKFCLGEVQCALGTKLLERLDSINGERRERALHIIDSLRNYPELSFQKVPKDCVSVYHLLSARYDGEEFGKNRDDFISLMAFQHGVQVIVQYYPLYRYPLFRRGGLGQADCPNTDYFFDNMVSFPFHHGLQESQIDYIIESTLKTLQALRV